MVIRTCETNFPHSKVIPMVNRVFWGDTHATSQSNSFAARAGAPPRSSAPANTQAAPGAAHMPAPHASDAHAGPGASGHSMNQGPAPPGVLGASKAQGSSANAAEKGKPVCRFGRKCWLAMCKFAHPDGRLVHVSHYEIWFCSACTVVEAQKSRRKLLLHKHARHEIICFHI
jgi:hypothetical protein